MEDIAISVEDVGKLYLLYDNIQSRVLDQLRLSRFMPWRNIKPREFWALRHINLKIKKGERVGIIGRNGSGKTTLLKLITQNFEATEGAVSVHGSVQALMTTGSGFNPEFTGRENVQASLQYMGLDENEIDAALREIAAFTELGQFLDQPFRSYSAGMQARLTFAASTCLKPDILIIDEILGAGDAYFAAKSAERMKSLVEDTNATILLVSHDLLSIQRYCNSCIWLDRGKIVEYSDPISTIKKYERFINGLEERRLAAKNQKLLQQNISYEQTEGYATDVSVRFCTSGIADLEIACVRIFVQAECHELMVGAPQDTDQSQEIYIADATANWSPPKMDGTGVPFRCLRLNPKDPGVHVSARFWNMLRAGDEVKFEVDYRTSSTVDVIVEMTSSAIEDIRFECSLEPYTEGFTSHASVFQSDNDCRQVSENSIEESKWRAQGEVDIEEIRICNSLGDESAVLEHGQAAEISFVFASSGTVVDAIPSLLIFTKSGVCVTKFIGEPVCEEEQPVRKARFTVNLDRLLLEDDAYLITAAVYRSLDIEGVSPSEYYCVLDKGAEFRVIGAKVVKRAVFDHPAQLLTNKF